MKTKTLVPGFVSFVFALTALAAPPNTIVLDGRVLEYDAVDLVSTFTGAVGDPLNTQPWGPDNGLTNLYVTWDSNYLYIAANAYIATSGVPNKVAVLLDVDPDAGTGATTTTNWLTGGDYITYNDVAWTAYDSGTPFGLDFMVASEGSSHNLIKVLYDGVEIPSTNNTVSLVDTFANIGVPGVSIFANIKKENPAYPLNAVEARIPWGVLYGSDTGRFGTVESGEVIPRGATVRLFANMHNNVPAVPYSSPMVIPPQGGSASWSSGFFVSDTYVDVVLDADSNGIPDLAVGDVNAPWIKALIGAAGQSQAFAQFNEPVTGSSVSNTLTWLVDGAAPTLVTMLQSDLVRLDLASPLPSAGTFITVSSEEVEDPASNSRFTFNFLNPVSGGMQTSVTVRFVLQTASGMGASPGATNFFINGSNFPLEWGYPPFTSSPLMKLTNTLYYRDVTFLPGSSTQLFYKYSAIMNAGGGRGTNNYEAVRLDDFANASRRLNIPTDGSSLVITDYLGAAAGPWRPGDDPTNGYNQLYIDTRRGDAGVRQRKTILFQLDLSDRNLAGVTRVLMQGTDPLRGFNVDNGGVSDYAGGGAVGWANGGITMVDDGTLGDLVAGDGIYSRLWSLSTNGLDPAVETQMPYSLVGGNFFDPTLPYVGSGWVDARSPQSFKYKFWVYKGGTMTELASPAADIVYYVPRSETNIVLEPFVWDNTDLPLPPPSNSPTMTGVVFTNAQATVMFENAPSELDHGIEVSYDLLDGWREYGLRGSIITDGMWQAVMPGVSTTNINFRAYAGSAPERTTTWWTPNPVPATGATVQVWFSQIGRENRGIPQVLLHSPLQLDGSIDEGNWISRPMTFLGDGLWTISMDVAALTNGTKNHIWFGFRNDLNGNWDGNFGPWGTENYRIIVGSRASWTPENPGAGDLLTITYDATGGVLAGGTNVHLHSGYNKFEGTDWSAAYENSPMTNIGGEVWTTTVQMNTNGFKTFNMLFRNNGDSVTWDSEYDQVHWVVFPEELQ